MTCIAGAYHQYFGFLTRKKVQIEKRTDRKVQEQDYQGQMENCEKLR